MRDAFIACSFLISFVVLACLFAPLAIEIGFFIAEKFKRFIYEERMK